MESKLFKLCRIFLGAVFLYACYDKILHPQAFAEAVYNYRILPDGLVNITAITLPWLELLIGICLVAGILLPGASTLSTILLLTFMSTLIFNLMRGLDVSCGCFSTDASEGPAGIWTVARDFSFLALSVYVSWKVLLGSAKPHDKSEGLQPFCNRASSS
ncbi:MAG: DoxX family protein [Deltaproteobacteria bacterium CG_4_8_14_3_um_filter_51_11]|nr:DoxX family membrane protein [bacterium]OIP37293.1 MAG: DoxX family protein [Desulfobacteraceae bacterium CG2_30_51_40]PIP44827.1 MAG: DoxX family protein [Deltaproteobacteria bacterium CG23_combo_of_CG06-09_8_20_14_all_51_20]PIV98688.1 MAG: DoxX family protein [Deltaproteobacteria bacterium CG17_big_fil_post_rev_8_21_14_2_50_51_6]PIX20744.1 MAG: DoxX family protein [Deltaproteobacteria bacterium CG_4_8_14_3_um_filter_51_11]PJB36281.1 MAG: DoxX family protein [Deltaproteobacteria bacterium 